MMQVVRPGLLTTVALACALVLPSGGATAQAGPPDRSDRVVIHSPHFNEVARPWGNLSCPGPPAQFFGFESTARTERTSLKVRALRNRTVPMAFHGEAGLQDVVLALTPYTGAGTPSPNASQAPYGFLTDSVGAAEFVAPAGLYWLEAMSGGFKRGVAVIRLREGASDSLHVHLGLQAICD